MSNSDNSIKCNCFLMDFILVGKLLYMIVHIDVYIPIIEVEQPVEREVQAERNIHPGRITSLWGQDV